MKELRYWQVFAFSKTPGFGNPAGVVWDAGSLSVNEMQEIARINNLSETAFLFPSVNKDIPYSIRFFTPVKSIPMCGHASVASAYVYWKISGSPDFMEFSQQAEVGTLKISIESPGKDARIYLQMDNPPLERNYDEYRDVISKTLGIDTNHIDSSLPVMINSREYLYIPVKDLITIQEMKPDFESMLKVDKKLGIHGWYVFTKETLDTENDFHCRFFVPSYGINEDPVTGTANAYFTEYYSRYMGGGNTFILKMEQGFEINRNGIVEVRSACRDGMQPVTQIGGNAVSYLDGTISI